MPKCKACGSVDVSRDNSPASYLWVYKCNSCRHVWLKDKYSALGIRVGPLALKDEGLKDG